MLDEVHERTAQIDIIMGLLKRRRDLKLLTGMEEVDHCVNMLKNYTGTDLISDPRDLEVEVSSVEQVTEEINTLALTGDSEVKKIS